MFKTNEFSYNDGTFSAFASDFGPGRMPARRFQLQSAKTGNVITMILEQTHTDRDNDVTHWTFTTNDCVAIKELIIWND